MLALRAAHSLALPRASMQRKGLELRSVFYAKNPCSSKLTNLWHILTNIISDIFFGYGESMFKMIVTYILTVFFFAWVFAENVNILEYTQALAISLKNIAGMDSETIRGVSPFVDMLNVIQTTLGILLTGIFGFILGNKIRNQ